MKKTRLISLLIVLTIMAISATGCTRTGPAANGTDKPSPPIPIEKKIILYFSDEQAEYLVAEERTIEVAADELQLVAEAVVNELIKGPHDAHDAALGKTIPPETKLLSVTIEDNTAVVDFSTELKTEHWGGSTGETMTIMSVVNSLTELPEIEKVQFLIEGQQQETLAGHWDLSAPISRDQKIIE